MKTNVSYVEKKLFVNEDKRTVACQLRSCIKIPEKYKFLLYEDSTFNDFLCANKNVIPDYDDEVLYVNTTGVAKCSEDDDFNQAIGEMIAITKAQTSVFNMAKNIFTAMLKAIADLYVEDLDILIKSNKRSADNCNNHIQEIFDDYKNLVSLIGYD